MLRSQNLSTRHHEGKADLFHQLIRFVFPYVALFLAFLGPSLSIFPFLPFPGVYHSVLCCLILAFGRKIPLIFLCFLTLLFDVMHGQVLGLTLGSCLVLIVVSHIYQPFLYRKSFVLQWCFFVFLIVIYSFSFWLFETLLGAGIPFEQWFLSLLWVGFSYPFVFFLMQVFLGDVGG